MRTPTSLALIAIGAVLAFAIWASTPGINLHIVGAVLILTGLAGLLLPGKRVGWLRKRLIIPRGRGQRPEVIEETRYPPFVVRNPGTGRQEAGLPDEPLIEPDPARQNPPWMSGKPGNPVAGEEIIDEPGGP
jgi:hypothetical protein